MSAQIQYPALGKFPFQIHLEQKLYVRKSEKNKSISIRPLFFIKQLTCTTVLVVFSGSVCKNDVHKLVWTLTNRVLCSMDKKKYSFFLTRAVVLWK